MIILHALVNLTALLQVAYLVERLLDVKGAALFLGKSCR